MANYKDLCQEILRTVNSVQFAGVAFFGGELAAAEYRKGARPNLNQEESQLSVTQSLIRMNSRKTLEPKFGKTLYSLTEYQNVKRATIILYDKGDREAILMLSFDKVADACSLMDAKLMPLLKRIGRSL